MTIIQGLYPGDVLWDCTSLQLVFLKKSLLEGSSVSCCIESLPLSVAKDKFIVELNSVTTKLFSIRSVSCK